MAMAMMATRLPMAASLRDDSESQGMWVRWPCTRGNAMVPAAMQAIWFLKDWLLRQPFARQWSPLHQPLIRQVSGIECNRRWRNLWSSSLAIHANGDEVAMQWCRPRHERLDEALKRHQRRSRDRHRLHQEGLSRLVEVSWCKLPGMGNQVEQWSCEW